MPVLEDLFASAATPQAYVSGFRDRFIEILRATDTEPVVRVIEMLEATCHAGGTVFVLGNGGSGAVAAHWVNDLGVNNLVEGQPGYRVISLGDNASAITAVGNDLDFTEIFSAQLRASLRPNDLVIALSVSGNSPNVVRAIEYANHAGVETIGFTGMNGGKIRDLVTLSVHTPSDVDEYGPVEDMFSVFMHVATGYIAMRRGRNLYH